MHSAAHSRNLFRLLHGNSLGHQLAQHQREVGQDQRNQDDAQRGQQLRVYRSARVQNRRRKAIGKILRGKGAAKEARQRNAYLNGGKETIRIVRQLQQHHGHLIALLRLMAKLNIVHRQHGYLRGRKVGIDQNQHKLKQ